MVKRGGITRVLPSALARDLFATLLAQGDGVPGGCLKSIALRGVISIFNGGKTGEYQDRIYINVGQTGLDRPGHGALGKSQWCSRNSLPA